MESDLATMQEPTETTLGSGQPSLSTILLSALWSLAVAGAVGQYFLKRQAWDALVGLSALLFGAGLIRTLGRTRPAISELPTLHVFTAKRLGFWVRTVVLLLGLALTLFLGMFIGTGFVLMVVCGLLGLGVTVAWRKSLTWNIVGMGLALGLLSALGTGFLGKGGIQWAVVHLITIPSAFTGGVLLLQRTQLGYMRLLEGRPTLVLKGFLVGGVLGVPAGLFNLLGNIQGQDTYITHWWQPLYAIVPAIAEESWARLFLVSFCYAALRPAADPRPRRAVVVAILISVLAFSSAHAGLNPFVIMIDGLLFSTPYALLLIKKDFEHAVGYHFITDFVRFIAAFL